jgi:hypothetical protein
MANVVKKIKEKKKMILAVQKANKEEHRKKEIIRRENIEKEIKRKENMKLWFFHVPKTGGMFLRNYFEKHHSDCIGMTKPRNHDGLIQLANPIKWKQLGHFQMKNPNNYYKFAFVRNPWDHRVSQYFYTSDEKRDKEKFLKMHPTFEHFIKATHDDQYKDKLRFRDTYHESNRYKNMLYSNGKLGMEYVGKYETLHEDVKKIFEINGIKMKVSIDKHYEEHKKEWKITNYSKHDHYSKYYTDELIDIVYEQEKLIIEEYDYKFERK